MFCFALIILLEELFYFNEELQSEPSVKESLTSSFWEDINDETESRPWNPIWHSTLPLDQWNSDSEGELDPGTTRDFPDPFDDGKDSEILSTSDEPKARFPTNAPRVSDIDPGYPDRVALRTSLIRNPV